MTTKPRLANIPQHEAFHRGVAALRDESILYVGSGSLNPRMSK